VLKIISYIVAALLVVRKNMPYCDTVHVLNKNKCVNLYFCLITYMMSL